jgi:hypothetical protein
VLLILTAFWAGSVWNDTSGVEMGKHGWIALGLGTFFSLLIGCGLMARCFLAVAAAMMMQPTHLEGEIRPPIKGPTVPDGEVEALSVHGIHDVIALLDFARPAT